MTLQHHELEAWLGDDHGLTGDQVIDLLATANDIHERYPDQDDEDERQAALAVAYQLMLREHHQVLEPLVRKLAQARLDELSALAGLRQAAVSLIPHGLESQAGFARRVGVNRMTVRDWLGLR